MRLHNLSVLLLLVICSLGEQAMAQQQQSPAAPAAVPAAPAAPLLYGTPVSIDQARAAATAAVAEAKKNNWYYAVAIVEPSGELVYFEKMDGTQYASTRIAQARARAAALFRRATKAFSDRVAQNDLSVLSLTEANWSEGGLPIIVGGKVIGAIGTSGGTQPQDGQVAKAGVDAVK